MTRDISSLVKGLDSGDQGLSSQVAAAAKHNKDLIAGFEGLYGRPSGGSLFKVDSSVTAPDQAQSKTKAL